MDNRLFSHLAVGPKGTTRAVEAEEKLIEMAGVSIFFTFWCLDMYFSRFRL
jgi:hypothetical protein